MFTLDDLKNNLNIEQLDTYLFRGTSLDLGLPRVFGGQVLAQALNAAFRSVPEDRKPHSMHAYFLRPGDTQRQIIYEVDPIRDGRSFATRRVVAKQNGEPIFNTSISFHKLEPGLSHQMEMPAHVPSPEALIPDQLRLKQFLQSHPEMRKPFSFPQEVVDIRSAYGAPFEEDREDFDGFWFKFNGKFTQNPIMHHTLLAFISDMRLMGTGLRVHGVRYHTHEVLAASLDHALWYHDDIDLNDWILYYTDSPRAGRARNFNRGSFYSREGKLIASSAQEGLARVLGEKESD